MRSFELKEVIRDYETMRCFECEHGELKEVIRDYETTGGKNNDLFLIVKDVPHLICDTCGDICFSSHASEKIEEARKGSGVVYRMRGKGMVYKTPRSKK